MIQNINQINFETIKNISKLYKKGIPLKKICNQYNLLHNELIAILKYGGIKEEEIKHNLISTSFNDEAFILISDTHIGSVFENFSYIEAVYDFALKNSIKNIFHTGDIFQSTRSGVNDEYINLNNQLKHFLNDYPLNKHYRTNFLLGNHDIHMFSDNNLFENFKNTNYIKVIGAKKAFVLWYDVLILLYHNAPRYSLDIPNERCFFRFSGHRHDLKIENSNIYVPTLSGNNQDYEHDPGFLLVRKNNNKMEVYHYRFTKSLNHNQIVNNGIILSKKMC